MEAVLLRVPPDSLRSLADLQEEMGNRLKMHHASYITQLTFDPNKEYPSILFNGRSFEGAGKITGDSALAVREMMASPAVKRIMYGNKTLRTVEQNLQLPDVTILPPPKRDSIPAAAPVTIEDVGKPEAADLSMDARVKAFLAAQ